jgi:hypothetical protein
MTLHTQVPNAEGQEGSRMNGKFPYQFSNTTYVNWPIKIVGMKTSPHSISSGKLPHHTCPWRCQSVGYRIILTLQCRGSILDL